MTKHKTLLQSSHNNALHLIAIFSRYAPFIVSAILTVFLAFSTIFSASSLLWPQTTATITDISVTINTFPAFRFSTSRTRATTVTYAYDASNQTFIGREILGGATRGELDKVVNQSPTSGRKLKLWVNPIFPTQSTLTPGEDLSNNLILLFFSALVTTAFAALEIKKIE